MAKPISLADGPFKLERVNGETVFFEASKDQINHFDVFVPVGVKDANVMNVAFDILDYILEDFFHHGLHPIGASDEAHVHAHAMPLSN
jgi:hypothetical protein